MPGLLADSLWQHMFRRLSGRRYRGVANKPDPELSWRLLCRGMTGKLPSLPLLYRDAQFSTTMYVCVCLYPFFGRLAFRLPADSVRWATGERDRRSLWWLGAGMR